MNSSRTSSLTRFHENRSRTFRIILFVGKWTDLQLQHNFPSGGNDAVQT